MPHVNLFYNLLNSIQYFSVQSERIAFIGDDIAHNFSACAPTSILKAIQSDLK
jgi:hypothetical protein